MSKPEQDTGIVPIHGKQYKTVALRIKEFREEFPDYGIETEILSAADVIQVKTTITNVEGRIVATGLAEEVRGSTNINKTSALENAETSAVGRALAFLGLAGTEIASADEVVDAINQQSDIAIQEKVRAAEKQAYQNAAACMRAYNENRESVDVIQENIADGALGLAKEAWNELSEATQRALWLAPTKGGVLTTQERETIKSDEWAAA